MTGLATSPPMGNTVSIRDTVHGYITLKEGYSEWIVDTPEFQRLRRIEQTAIRSLYPTARHDRFVHSLGVYHIGEMILDHFVQEWEDPKKIADSADIYHLLVDEPEGTIIQSSYLMACLLHDIGHAPFSHTFEVFFAGNDKEALRERLFTEYESSKVGGLEVFKSDLKKQIKDGGSPANHECTSAMVVLSRFKEAATQLGADAGLMARMIIGCKYSQADTLDKQVRNIFIELLHGGVIDADRLDYACRDIWASGYSTSSVDLHRLIHAMHLRFRKTETGDREAVLCYNSKVTNELESVLAIRDFQSTQVFCHHTIVYDQYLLQEAAKTMARKYFTYNMPPKKGGEELTESEQRRKALANIISVDALLKRDYHPKQSDPEKKKEPNVITINGKEITTGLLEDADLLFLMKQLDGDENPCYKEWSSRQYRYYPLWKTSDEFHDYFPVTKPIIGDMARPVKFQSPSEENFREAVENALHCKKEDVIVLRVELKPKISLEGLYLWVNGKVIKYEELFPHKKFAEKFDPAYQGSETIFYVFYKKKDGFTDESKRAELIDRLKDPIQKLYERVNNPKGV